MAQKIDRISFHFNDRCPHKCGFCYMPFDRRGVGKLEDWLRILDRVAEFQPSLVSFAGGDPCVYKSFYSLLGKMKKESYVNLISTGYYLQKERYRLVSHKIDCFCIAFDEVPNLGPIQRYDEREFRKFDDVLQFVSSMHENLTINTLVTPANKDNLGGIAEYLISKGLNRVKWNLYKFWPFEFIAQGDKYALTNEEFETAISRVSADYSTKLDIRGWHPDERKMGYFFVTSLGEVYTVDKDNSNRYVFLGSIFQEDIFDKWSVHNTPAEVATKYHQIVDREIAQGAPK